MKGTERQQREKEKKRQCKPMKLHIVHRYNASDHIVFIHNLLFTSANGQNGQNNSCSRRAKSSSSLFLWIHFFSGCIRQNEININCKRTENEDWELFLASQSFLAINHNLFGQQFLVKLFGPIGDKYSFLCIYVDSHDWWIWSHLFFYWSNLNHLSDSKGISGWYGFSHSWYFAAAT